MNVRQSSAWLWALVLCAMLAATQALLRPATADDPAGAPAATEPAATEPADTQPDAAPAESQTEPSDETQPADESEPADEPKPEDGEAPESTGEKSDDAASELSDEEYYELLRLFADTLDQVDRNYVNKVSRRELIEAAINGMVSKLDQYSDYIPPEEIDRFKGSVESEFGGIGIQVSVDGGELTVISPIVGSPAYRAGLAAGDKIVEIAGEPTKDITLDDAVKLMKGDVGTEVEIAVRHTNGEREEFSIKREIVRVQTVLGDQHTPDDAWNYMYDDERKIAYIRITSFARHTTEELKEALKKASDQGLKGLVLDLRFNPGGLLQSAIETSDLFVADGPIVSTAGRNVPAHSWNAREDGKYEDFPMVVLVNRFSASASEIVSACLQDHERAKVIGERTWGKASVQNIIDLEGGKSALKLTTAGYRRPNGKNIDRHAAEGTDEWGVRPDEGFEVKMSDEEVGQYLLFRRYRDIVRGDMPTPDEDTPPAFDDRALAKAIEYLTQEVAPPTEEKKPAEEEKPAEAEQAADAGK